jgi:phosphoglycolate phosphatase
LDRDGAAPSWHHRPVRSHQPTLVLWDIDRTLVSIGGWSRRVYEDAFLKVTGQALRELADMAGRTERAILTDTLALHDIPASVETIDACFAALGAAAHDLREAVAGDGYALPGAAEALRMLADHGAVQTVVTGNLRPVAVIKLEAFDLTEHIDFEIGGYGEDSTDRAPLIRTARERATDKFDRTFPDGRVVVIGDTPHDIKGARDVGVRAIGVATGGSSAEALRNAEADAVLADLRDSAALRDLVFGATV